MEEEVQKPDFWNQKERAVVINKQLSRFQEEINAIEGLKGQLVQLKEDQIENFEKKLRQKEVEIFLSGRYDRGNAILSIYAGAGGQDAQDWATMLLRMYERYRTFRGLKTKILEQSFGESGGPDGRIGTKSVTLEIQGNFAYGFLKGENGVHRLVRISPFSQKSLRHTSFALVEVIPDISDNLEEKIKISPQDLRVETFRASGPGGQYVNKRESAVRITHLPTGLRVACQLERLQGQNKETAMKILIAKIHQLKEKEQQKELKEIKGDRVSASWGNQIRSYVLHPYKMVKDLRTGIESSNVEKVLDGDLDQFINAQLEND